MDIDIKRIKESIELLKPNNQLYEIRILLGSGRRKTTISGYFKGTKNLEKAFSTIDLRHANVFYTLNRINDECYAREQHECFRQIDDTTSDSDIVGYQWFLIDLDPKRRTGISSTSKELNLAKEKAKKIKSWLKEQGFSDPIIGLSGNGVHLLYSVDFPNDAKTKEMLKNCLYSIDSLFTDDKVEVDKSVFNPSRVSKLYGTYARKGSSTEERPHRLSCIMEVPDKISATERAKFEKLAAIMPEQEPVKIKKKSSFDVENWLSDNGIRVNKTTQTSDGATKYILEACPFDGSHKAPDSMIIVQPTGQIGFRCLHNSCIGHTWQDLRLMYEPDAYDDKNAENDARIEEGWKVHKQYMITKKTDDVEEVKKNLPTLTAISAFDLQQKVFPDTYYAVANMIPEGETVIAAPPKTGKSWLMLDMCLKVASGTPFLGFDTTQSDTIYLALEDGDKFEQERLNIVCPKEAPKNFHFIFENVLHLNEGFLLQLDALFESYPNTKLVVIDTLNFIQYHPAKGESAYSCDYRTGKDLKTYAEKRGIAIVVVTHTTKMLHQEDEMMNVSGTNGVTGAADAVIVLSKEKRTDMDAKMFITGRKVRQSMHEIKFNDKTCIWEYNGVADVGETKDQREREEKERLYNESPIRDAVINISMHTDDFWRGKASDIIQRSVELNIGLKESAKEVGGFMTQMLGMFLNYDNVKIEKIKNGTGPAIYKIYKQLEDWEG